MAGAVGATLALTHDSEVRENSQAYINGMRDAPDGFMIGRYDDDLSNDWYDY